ncbi:MAG: hypothetical protein JXA21_15105 [Anaerolineae bacterium]|nr:hypothetical protein [Anaerolineae bacterium]
MPTKSAIHEWDTNTRMANQRTGEKAGQRASGPANYELRVTNSAFHGSRFLSRFQNPIACLLLFASLLLTPYSLLLTPVFAQSTDVIALWESDVPPAGGWTVGDPVALRLRVVVPEGTQVTLPELPETWGDFEIQSQVAQPPVTQDGKTTVILATTAVLWAPGNHETPPTVVKYQDAVGEHAATATPLTVSIASVLAEATPGADGQIEKRDLKPQATLPRPPLWPWLLGGTVLLLALYFAGRWLWERLPHRRGVETLPEEAPVDLRPPEEIAYAALDEIVSLDLPARGEFKEHYTRLTDCLRVYVEGVYGVPALDCTTYELVAALRAAKLKGEPLTALRELLSEADLVKFAKFAPSVAPAREAVARARSFVDDTRPERTEPEF